MFHSAVLFGFTLLGIVHGQQVGTYQTETHPRLTWQKCTKGGSCQTVQGSVVLDSNWRWTHVTNGYTNCYTGNEWNSTVCTDNARCASNCAIDGADYSATYGITSSGNALTMKFVTKGQYSTNVGARVYLMDTDTKYYMFKPKGMEFTFDVDVSGLPCGLNGALYFSEMEADGGMGKYSGNKAGAKYGTGYCDAQCPHDIKFINGEANVEGWKPSESDANAGTGKYGTCCNEMDIWEANSISTAYTPHSCTKNGPYRCSGTECGDNPDNRYGGVCDKDGCDFNSFRMGDQSFYGPGKTVDTSKKMTVVTQFITDTNTTSGTLSEIRRLYVQNGKVIQNSKVNIPGMSAFDSITKEFCAQQKEVFGDKNDYEAKGGWPAMSKSFDNGVVLVLSIWDDYTARMLWLDSNYPLDKDPSTPGVARGTCSTDSGNPKDVEANSPNAQVIYSNIKFGDIGSTYSAR